MSCRKTLVRAALAATLASFLGSFALWACGPFFAAWLLTDEADILAAPTAWLRQAMEPLLPPGKPQHAAVPAENGPYQQTAAADRADLAAVVSDPGVVERYSKVRAAMVQYGEAVEAWRQEAMWAKPAPPRPEPPAGLAVPAGVPGEFADYLKGAIAYHQGKPGEARAAWQKLLERPAKERRARSTWAAYMLGKTYLQEDPAAAARWFGRTRELAADGFRDSLGLAASSYGWEARAELNRQRPAEALVLYARQMKTGDPTAVQSIRKTASGLLDQPEALQGVAASEAARPIVTAYVLSIWNRVDYDGPPDPEPARKWLEALRAAGVDKAKDADRIAWIAYRAGDFAAAENWLKLAPADAPMARWIRAKLLMRAGKLAEAQALLEQAAPGLPAGLAPWQDAWSAYENQVVPPLRPRLAGESGAVLLAQGKYPEALRALLAGGYWADAAYVAERVMTLDELRAAVDKGVAPKGPENPEWSGIYAGLAEPPGAQAAKDLRYLLARRLVRAGQHAEAAAYMPEGLKPALEELRRALAQGRDAGQPVSVRAGSLFRAACITRYQGLELLGTEVEPDWAYHSGQFDLGSFAEARQDPERHERLGPGEDEKVRVRRHRAQPAKRFHYRYVGMDLAQEAAALLKGEPDEQARLLATAGNWIEGRDPVGALPLLNALLSCCGETEIGQRAQKLNAIPNIEDACPAETKVSLEAAMEE